MATPRRYQERAINGFLDFSQSKEQLATIILPTGTGKTKTAAWALESTFKTCSPKVLWGAHREELIDQAYKELIATLPNINIQIEMADRRASADAQIIVGTVQTLHRNRKNMIGFEPNIVVVDEWHHFAEDNKQYQGLMDKYPNAKFLGLTATPYRFTGGILPLGRKLIEMDIGVAVAHNYLVPPKPEVLKSNVSLAGVKTRAGDFAVNELSAAVNVGDRNSLIAKRVLQAVKEEKRQGILFSVDVAHSQAMAAILRKELRVGEVYGETEKEERRILMDKIRNGEIDVLCNNLVATEGFDVPHLSFVCIARPTRSLGLYIQMMGRGLRLFDGKNDCSVIDVFDKIKTTQTRITFSDAASATDLDGAQRRLDAIIKEKLPEELTNFPVFLSNRKIDRWTIDDDTWFAPAWILDEGHWVITWAKREARIESDEYEYVPFNFTPSKWSLERNPIEISHPIHGPGLLFSIDDNKAFPTAIILVEQDKRINVPFIELTKKSKRFERKKLDKPIKRAFYICLNQDQSKGRLISLLQESEDSAKFKVVADTVGDKTTLDEMVKVAAAQDDVTHIVKADAKWRSKPMSDKQRAMIEKFIAWKKIGSDLDLDTMTGGDAAAIMDQVTWVGIVTKLFGTNTRKNLMGYSAMADDV